jgi:hypothetical protein
MTFGLDIFQIVRPSFCYDSLIPSLCFSIFNLIEIVGIIIIVYYLFIKKGLGKQS